MDFLSSNARNLDPDTLAAVYVERKHDRALIEAVKKNEQGNILLLGGRGTGKTSAIKFLSGRLSRIGIAHKTFFSGRELSLAPALHDINLFDDFASVADLTPPPWAVPSGWRGAVDFLQNTPVTTIIAITPADAALIQNLIPIRRVIEIAEMTTQDTQRMMERYLHQATANPDMDRFDYLVRSYLNATPPTTPRDLLALFNGMHRYKGGLKYRAGLSEYAVENVRPQIIQVTDSMLAKLKRFKGDPMTLSPREFEHLVGELFERDGYSVEMTKASRDGGVDLFARKKDIGGQNLVVVQCKRYSMKNPVRVNYIRELAGAINIQNATAGAIFTTSRFTRDATLEARQMQTRLSLTDYFDLMRIVERIRDSGG